MKKLFFYTLFFTISLSLFAEEKYDWLINNNWQLETEFFDIYKPSKVKFRKLEIIPKSTMYQDRLRNLSFTLQYQTDEKDKLFILERSSSNGYYEVKFGDNYTTLSLTLNGRPYGTQERVGKQENKNYPLVGIWGKLPYLTERRIIDPKDCYVFMEIEEKLPMMAVREGHYLLKQINEKTYETVSSFPDGLLRLTVENENEITLTPLFQLPKGEGGILLLLTIKRVP